VRTELVETTMARFAAAALAGGEDAVVLEPLAFRALVERGELPARSLVLERAQAPTVEAWAAASGPAALTVLDPEGRVRLVRLPAAALAATLERLTGLDEGPAAGEARALTPGVSPGAHHSRLVAGDQTLELARGDDGWGRIVVAPDGSASFRPESAADLRRALRELVQRA
jgi:hypothetical protein